MIDVCSLIVVLITQFLRAGAVDRSRFRGQGKESTRSCDLNGVGKRRGQGCGASLGELADVYRVGYQEFVRVARAITGEEQAAIDAVHDAFVSAVRGRADFRGGATVKTWRIVINAAQRERNRGAAVVATDPYMLNALVEAKGNGTVTPDGAARALLASLPERQRLVLFLRHYADLGYAEIAEIIEVAPGTVAATLHAARASLRTQLELEEERCPHKSPR